LLFLFIALNGFNTLELATWDFYFVVILLQLEILDVNGLLISAFGLLESLVASIVSTLEKIRT